MRPRYTARSLSCASSCRHQQSVAHSFAAPAAILNLSLFVSPLSCVCARARAQFTFNWIGRTSDHLYERGAFVISQGLRAMGSVTIGSIFFAWWCKSPKSVGNFHGIVTALHTHTHTHWPPYTHSGTAATLMHGSAVVHTRTHSHHAALSDYSYSFHAHQFRPKLVGCSWFPAAERCTANVCLCEQSN